MPPGVVVDHHDQGVRLLAGVAEHAHDFVAVAEGVGVHVAVAGGHGADVLGPGGRATPALHQRQRGRLRLHRLARRAQAGDAGQQRERGRAALLGGVADQALADQFLDVGRPVGAAGAAAPPGAEQLAHHELGVERAAHREQLPRGPQHLGEQRVRRWRRWESPSAAPCRGRSGPARLGALSSALRAHMDSFPDSRRAVPRPRRMVAMFPRVADITGISTRSRGHSAHPARRPVTLRPAAAEPPPCFAGRVRSARRPG